jgi:hypothetical protein
LGGHASISTRFSRERSISSAAVKPHSPSPICLATTSCAPLPNTPAIPRPIDSRSLFVLNSDMSVVLEINRDYPYQVALSFDDAAMEILDWLEGCDFDWDMYVDLPENTVRYCFRTLADASAFKRRFGNASEGRAVASGN